MDALKLWLRESECSLDALIQSLKMSLCVSENEEQKPIIYFLHYKKQPRQKLCRVEWSRGLIYILSNTSLVLTIEKQESASTSPPQRGKMKCLHSATTPGGDLWFNHGRSLTSDLSSCGATATGGWPHARTWCDAQHKSNNNWTPLGSFPSHLCRVTRAMWSVKYKVAKVVLNFQFIFNFRKLFLCKMRPGGAVISAAASKQEGPPWTMVACKPKPGYPVHLLLCRFILRRKHSLYLPSGNWIVYTRLP